MPTIGHSARSNTTSWTSRIKLEQKDSGMQRTVDLESWSWSLYEAVCSPRIFLLSTISGKRLPVQRSLSEWALRWVWNHPEVTVVLSGMSSFEQVEQNVAYAESGLPNSLSEEELDLFKEAETEYKKRIKVPCTGCRYCSPVHLTSAFLNVLKCITRVACSMPQTLPASITI